MAKFNFNNIRVLVADDFSSFRTAIGAMLGHLGVMNIDFAGSAEEAIVCCREKTYDVVLCDYDLANGRTGQHVLEEIRHFELIPRSSVFIMISADASRDVVMSAYDCQPDEYLAKPINAYMLEKRLIRLLVQRAPLRPVFDALQRGDQRTAVILLTDLSLSESRSSVLAQKLLGELFLEYEEYDKASKLYAKALGERETEWARLGMAWCKLHEGELDAAQEYFQLLIDENDLYLPAYDGLAEVWQRRGDKETMQQVMERVTEISPISILRQKRLSAVAEENGHLAIACQTMSQVVKLGEHSVHGSITDGLRFGRLVASLSDENLKQLPHIANEAIGLIQSAKQRFTHTDAEAVQVGLIEARLHIKKDNKTKAARLVEIYEEKSLSLENTDIETDIERVQALKAIGNEHQADALLRQLLQRYYYDQAALELLDQLLDEPVSEANKTIVANVNREGIELYNQHFYDDALACFEKARRLFPKHAGIQLNIIQALLGKVKSGEKGASIRNQVLDSLELVGRLIDPEYPQYKRYRRLTQMADECL